MSVLIGPIAQQLPALEQVFPGTTAVPQTNGTTLITVPGVPLPAGWNQAATAISFLVPVGYPMARPDCFWADSGLRLAGGGMPQNAGLQQVPGVGDTRLWFSWHLATWNPGNDSLLTFVRVIQNRLAGAH